MKRIDFEKNIFSKFPSSAPPVFPFVFIHISIPIFIASYEVAFLSAFLDHLSVSGRLILRIVTLLIFNKILTRSN